MASLCRTAANSSLRSISSLRNKTLNPKTLSSPFPFPTSSIPRASRIAVALSSLDSLMPLHSAVASSRLKSRIGIDSSCWSWMSQDFGVPR